MSVYKTFKRNNEIIRGITKLPDIKKDDEFEKNNNETENQLLKVQYSTYWNNEKVLMTSTGSLTIVIVIAVGAFLITKCMKCKEQRERVVINMNEKAKIDEVAMNEHKIPETECECKQKLRQDELELNADHEIPECHESHKRVGNHRPMCKFPH